MVTCSLDIFEEERNKNEKGKSRGVTKNYIHWKGDGKVKDRDDDILGFDFLFVG